MMYFLHQYANLNTLSARWGTSDTTQKYIVQHIGTKHLSSDIEATTWTPYWEKSSKFYIMGNDHQPYIRGLYTHDKDSLFLRWDE